MNTFLNSGLLEGVLRILMLPNIESQLLLVALKLLSCFIVDGFNILLDFHFSLVFFLKK